MIRLHLFAGLAIRGDEGLTGLQRKPLALLAVLAASGRQGLPREKAATLLWPESDSDHARNALNQTLHHLRRGALREVIAGGAQLRLDDRVITSDVADFRIALEKGDLARATSEYTGPFLDGVYIRDGSEFERWAESQRSELAQMYAKALRALAEQDDARGEHAAAGASWRQLVQHAPLSTRATLGLMRALAAGGDHTEALSVARRHNERVRAELGTPMASEIVQLVERLNPRQAELRAPATNPIVADGAARAAPVADVQAPTPVAVAAEARLPRRRRGPFAWTAGVGIALALTIIAIYRPPPSAAALSLDRIVVGRFDNLTGDSTLDIVGSMAADWITQGLARGGTIPVAGHSVEVWSSLGSKQQSGGWRELGRQAQSRMVVHGSYGESHDTIRIQAIVSDARSGQVIQAIETVAGPRSDPMGAVEVLRQRVVSVFASRRTPELRHWITTAGQPASFAAYLDYATGMQAFADGRWADARNGFLRSAREDSTYTLPLLWAVFALSNNDEELPADSLRKALVHRQSTMAPFDRALLEYLDTDTLIVYPKLIHHEVNRPAQYLAASRLVELAPGSEFLWKLAMAARAVGRVHEAERILRQLDPDLSWVKSMNYWETLADLYALLGDYRAALEVTRHEAAHTGWNVPQLARRAEWSAMLGDVEEVRTSLVQIAAKAKPTEALVQVPAIASGVARQLRSTGRSEEATRVLRWALTFIDTSSAASDLARDRIRSLFAANQRAWLLYNLGRLREAQSILEQLVATFSTEKNGERAVTLDLPGDAMVSVYGDLAAIAARLGDGARVDHYRQLILTAISPGDGSEKYSLGRIAALQGRRDEAVRWLSAAREIKIDVITDFRKDPDLDSLRDYPPFRALLVLPSS